MLELVNIINEYGIIIIRGSKQLMEEKKSLYWIKSTFQICKFDLIYEVQLEEQFSHEEENGFHDN